MTQVALTRRSLLHQRTTMWMHEHFLLHADFCPNSLELHLELCTKRDICEIYQREMPIIYSNEEYEGKNRVFVTYDVFVSL